MVKILFGILVCESILESGVFTLFKGVFCNCYIV